MIGGGVAELHEHVGQVIGEIAGVASSHRGLDVDADLDATGKPQVEGLHDAGRRTGEPRHERREVGLVGDLGQGRVEPGLFSETFQGPEQLSLSHSAQTRHHQALLGSTEPQPLEEISKGIELGVTAVEHQRPASHSGRVRVAHGVHTSTPYQLHRGVLELNELSPSVVQDSVPTGPVPCCLRGPRLVERLLPALGRRHRGEHVRHDVTLGS